MNKIWAGRYIIKWVSGLNSPGDAYCFECGESIIADGMYTDNSTRVHRLNCGIDKYICKKCGREFGPFTHITVITDDFI